jgi:hypothetical protein
MRVNPSAWSDAMAGMTRMDGGRLWNRLRAIGWAAAALLLVLPLAAMRLGVPGIVWTLSDFLVMGALMGTCGLVLELVTRLSVNLAYRFAATVGVGAAFLLVWVNLAVGFLGGEDNFANLMFLGVILVAAVGTLAVRARAGPMTHVLMATAAAQLLAGIIGYAAGWASPGGQAVYEVMMGTALFTGLWLISAYLFARAARAGA